MQAKKKRKTSDNIAKVVEQQLASKLLSTSSSTVSTGVVDIFCGMTKASDESYEVWMHGDCAVWSSGVHIIGTRIIGLEAAVWSSSRHLCTLCGNYGAMLCCLQRGCTTEVHVPCARNNNWCLCDDNFKSLCDKHYVKTTNNTTIATESAIKANIAVIAGTSVTS